MQNIKEILSSMLADLDKGVSVEEIVASKMKEVGLSDESQTKVNEAVEYVEKIDAASESLKRAIGNGASRQEWLNDRIDDMIEKLPEEQQEKAEKLIAEVVKKGMENI